MRTDINIESFFEVLEDIDPVKSIGKVEEVIGLIIISNGPASAIGDLCYIIPPSSVEKIPVEVVGFRGQKVLSMCLGEMKGIAPGSRIESTGAPFRIKVSDELLGRIIDGSGEPIDKKGPVINYEYRSIHNDPPDPLSRERIKLPIATGIRAIDGLLTIGLGQRM